MNGNEQWVSCGYALSKAILDWPPSSHILLLLTFTFWWDAVLWLQINGGDYHVLLPHLMSFNWVHLYDYLYMQIGINLQELKNQEIHFDRKFLLHIDIYA